MAKPGQGASNHDGSHDTVNPDYVLLRDRLFSMPHVFCTLPTSPHGVLIPQHPQQQQSQNQSQDQDSTKMSSATAPTIPTIASLSLHPSLESALHIMNLDLPSAHFLLRHAQNGPAWEMMMLHGLLHRVEGDITNTRAWYGNVKDTEVFRAVWDQGGCPAAEGTGGKAVSWEEFLDRVERWRDATAKRDGSRSKTMMEYWAEEEDELKRISLWEIRAVLGFCEDKFGTAAVVDATTVWVKMGEKHGKMAKDMIMGGEGWRVF